MCFYTTKILYSTMTERKCCKPFSRGTTLLLVWSALIGFSFWNVRVNVILLLPFPNQELNSFLSKAYTALLALLPVTGWISDSLLGRYRAITIGSFLLAVAYLVILISFVMLQFDWTIPAFVCNVHFIACCCYWWWNILHKLTTICDRPNDWSLS